MPLAFSKNRLVSSLIHSTFIIEVALSEERPSTEDYKKSKDTVNVTNESVEKANRNVCLFIEEPICPILYKICCFYMSYITVNLTSFKTRHFIHFITK